MRRIGIKQMPFTEIQKLKLDLDAGNRLLMRDPNKVMAVMQKYAPYNLMSLFGIALTGQENGLEEVSIGRRDWSDTILKWRQTDYRRPPIYVLDATSIPGTIKAGIPFQIGLSEGYPDNNAVLDTEDPDYQIFIQSKIATAGKKHMYWAQGISNNSTNNLTKLPALLSYNRKLSFTGDNGVGEKSAKGQTAMLRQNGFMEYYNVMQTLRTDYEATGHYLSTDNEWDVMVEQYMENGKARMKAIGGLPFAGESMRQHIQAVSHRLYYGIGNLDMTTKSIVNQSPDGPYADRPLASGMREFYNATDHIYDYNPRRPEMIISLLKKAAQIARDRMRNIPPSQRLGFKIITRSGGEAVVLDAWQDILLKSNQQLHTSLAPGGDVSVGYGLSNFMTTKGDKFTLANIDYALSRDTYREQYTAGGLTADKDSWEIAIMPLYNMKETLGPKNINIVTKKHTLSDGTVINRGLVVGRQMGMTGLSNSTGQDIGALQESQINKVYADSYRVDSMVDKESMGFLSEFSFAMFDPDDIILLKPQIPSLSY